LQFSHHIKGGIIAHIARRLFHIAMVMVPFFYYYFLIHLAPLKIIHLCILGFIFFVFLFEKFRLRTRLILFAQRAHESSQISTFAWTILSLGIVLIFSPSISFSVPIIATCALVDPLLGEMRLYHTNKKIIIIVGVLVSVAIWFVASKYYGFPLWYGMIIAPISVAVEWPAIKWIDDNALMLLVPLVLVWIF